MTISKGAEWGTTVPRPAGLRVAASDAELADLLAAGTASPLAVRAGDLHRTVGFSASTPTVQRVDVDLLRVEADGRALLAVAHVIARRGWWRGPLIGVFNAEHLGTWDVAPRGHPNDGRAEIVEVDAAMSPRERWQAWRRLGQGTHVPHPRIATSSRTTAEWTFRRPLDLHVDGRRRGRVTHLRVTVQPDAYRLHV